MRNLSARLITPSACTLARVITSLINKTHQQGLSTSSIVFRKTHQNETNFVMIKTHKKCSSKIPIINANLVMRKTHKKCSTYQKCSLERSIIKWPINKRPINKPHFSSETFTNSCKQSLISINNKNK